MIACDFCDEWFHGNCGGDGKARTENRSVCLSWKQKKRVCCVKTKRGRENEVGVQRQKSKPNFYCCRMASGGWEWPQFYRDQELYPDGRREDQRAIGSYVLCSIPACARMVSSHELHEHAIQDHLPQVFFFGIPTQVSTAVAFLANAMVGHGGVRDYTISCVRSTSSLRIISFIWRRTTSLDQWPGTGGTTVRSISPCIPPTPLL